MIRFLLISVLISTAKCQELSQTAILENALSQTTEFFAKLKMDYGSQNLDHNTLPKIENEISEYIKNATELIRTRTKRQLDTSAEDNKDIDVLSSFQDVLQLTLMNPRDIVFFSMKNNLKSVHFAAVLDSSSLSLFLFNNTFDLVASYPNSNGIRVIVDSCLFGALLIIQNENSAVILRVIQDNDRYLLYGIQDLEAFNATHLISWHGMNQLYLAVASSSNISIFNWFGEYFDLAQVITSGADKLLPFYSKEFMHLAAAGSTTKIFKYSLRTNTFLMTQRLPDSQDIASFHLKDGHLKEHYLILSTNKSVVLYKEVHDRFVPFQHFAPARSIVSLIVKKAILLLFLVDDTVITYQYDGWRFTELRVKISQVQNIRKINYRGEECLLVEHVVGTWKLMRPQWAPKKSWKNLKDEIKEWCIDSKKKAARLPKPIPKLEGGITITKGHIDQLFTETINNHDARILEDLSKQYERVLSKYEKLQEKLANKNQENTTVFETLRAKKVRVKCKDSCNINRLNIEGTNHPNKIRTFGDKSNALNFGNLGFKELGRCPLIALPIEDIYVRKLINGISLKDLNDNALKVVGDQVISGEYMFSNLNATDAIMPLNLASHSSKQVIHAEEIRVKKLNLTDGGLLLPLNGGLTTITGSLKAAKVKLTGKVDLHGGLTGKAVERLSPVILISEPMIVDGDFDLQNITVERLLNANDLILSNGKSVKHILENKIALTETVPVPLKLFSENMKWDNVTLHNHPNWITANSKERIVITGRKYIPRNITVSKYVYDNINFPKIESRLCGVTAIVPEVKSSTMMVDHIIARRINATYIIGEFGPNNITSGPSIIFNSLTVQNLSVANFQELDLEELRGLVSQWEAPNIFRGSIEMANLRIDNLISPIRFTPISLPEVVGNVISKGNTYVGTINGVNFADFLENAVNINDNISLGNVTFSGGFSSNHTYATKTNFNFTRLGESVNLKNKRILGNLETNSIELPYSFQYNKGVPANVTIWGSATFATEPKVENINSRNLKEMCNNVWTTKNRTVFSGKNLIINNASMEGNIILNGNLSALNSTPWTSISQRIFSKTKSQEITVPSSFKNIEVPGIIGSESSKIISLIPELNDSLDNALMKNKEQRVKGHWEFAKMFILGKLHTKGKINNMNLRTDVVRTDVETNVITGKKTVTQLATKDLHGLRFNEFVRNALTQNGKKYVIIKGRKSFNNALFNSLSVFGSVMGHRIEEALLKSGDQKITGKKTIKGSISAPGLIIDGLINDVNLTDVMHYQLKKNKSSQIIETDVEFSNDLTILGNLTIQGLYPGMDQKSIDEIDNKIASVAEEFSKYMNIVDAINIAMENRAVYINKLEIIREDSVNLTDSDKQISVDQFNQLKCENDKLSLLCDRERLKDFVLGGNTTSYIIIKIIVLKGNIFVVSVKQNGVSVFLANDERNNLNTLTDLYVPNIKEAFVEPSGDSFWIFLQLPSETLVLRHEPWGDFQEYVLPATEIFKVSRTPNDQLLLLQSDGIWNFEGLTLPKNIIDFPLRGEVDIFVRGPDYYIKTNYNGNVTLLKARYFGN